MPTASSAAWDDNDFEVARHRAALREAARPATPRLDIDTGPSSRFGASTLGARMLARPGCLVFSDPAKLADHDGNGVGGVLLEVVDSARIGDGVDPDTGEVLTPRRTFRCWDRAGKGSYVIVPEDVAGPDSITGFDNRAAIKATFQMARMYMERRGPQGTRLLVGFDADLAHHISILVQQILGGGQ